MQQVEEPGEGVAVWGGQQAVGTADLVQVHQLT